MENFYIPLQQPIIKLEFQPDFPHADLNENNTTMLKHVLTEKGGREGLQAHAEQLEDAQRYIHFIGDLALKAASIQTRYDETELRAFSHGFATFETITSIVQPPRAYNIQAARQAIHKIFVDTSDSLELEHRELLLATAENRAVQPISRERVGVEFELADRHAQWTQAKPNTYDVVVETGAKRSETIKQIHARIMGAHIAYLLESAALDEAA